jgi:hypothetical protein
METNMQITEVKKYEKNAKEHPGFQLEKIASIQSKAFGCKQPIILDKDKHNHSRTRPLYRDD